MKPVPGAHISGEILWAPEEPDEARFSAPSEVQQQPVLEMPVMRPIDLTETHGHVVTLARLQEMAAAYDPEIETASLNFDHASGGPSLGWCEKLWLEEEILWARYVDLDPAVVSGIREKRYTRRSAEVAFRHPDTGGWYFIGCAILGNKRPAISLPPLKLYRPQYVLQPKEKKPVPDPSPPSDPSEAELHLATMRQQAKAGELALAETLKALAALRLARAESDAELALERLGARVTPGMKKLAKPLLVSLMATAEPQTIHLSLDGTAPAADHSIATVLLQILAAVPEVEALTAGRLADAADAAAAVSHASLPPERLAELAARFNYQQSWGYRQ